ncbi:MAG TPA: transposase family protein [Xanthobacteraceae bacterium]|nr:transposase family protein [Xanthobacteraceae bacterium]
MLDEEVPRDRLALLLKHFSQIKDERDPWRVLYPLSEVLLLVVCATIVIAHPVSGIGSPSRVSWIARRGSTVRRRAVSRTERMSA